MRDKWMLHVGPGFVGDRQKSHESGAVLTYMQVEEASKVVQPALV
jgi:hypothetical protein